MGLNLVLVVDLMWNLLLPSVSGLRRQQLALRIKPMLIPGGVSVEANCGSVR